MLPLGEDRLDVIVDAVLRRRPLAIIHVVHELAEAGLPAVHLLDDGLLPGLELWEQLLLASSNRKLPDPVLRFLDHQQGRIDLAVVEDTEVLVGPDQQASHLQAPLRDVTFLSELNHRQPLRRGDRLEVLGFYPRRILIQKLRPLLIGRSELEERAVKLALAANARHCPVGLLVLGQVLEVHAARSDIAAETRLTSTRSDQAITLHPKIVHLSLDALALSSRSGRIQSAVVRGNGKYGEENDGK